MNDNNEINYLAQEIHAWQDIAETLQYEHQQSLKFEILMHVQNMQDTLNEIQMNKKQEYKH